MTHAPLRIRAIGEAMFELAPRPEGGYQLGHAGDTFYTLWHMAQLLGGKAGAGMVTRIGQDCLSDAFARDMAQRCEALGVHYEIISIKDVVTAFENIFSPPASAIAEPSPPHAGGLGGELKGVAHENIQSRIRGTTLMALSNMSGAMVVSTGNKSEMAVGYATLYGDMNGGFNPLKDLYKTQVYALSRWRNAQSPVIPDNILTKAPTAELRPDQKDQDSLPPYDVLDGILKCLIEYDMGLDQIIEEGFDRETILKVWKLLDRAEYKRRQACPGVKVTGKAFGRDRRIPMTNKFLDNF